MVAWVRGLVSMRVALGPRAGGFDPRPSPSRPTVSARPSHSLIRAASSALSLPTSAEEEEEEEEGKEEEEEGKPAMLGEAATGRGWCAGGRYAEVGRKVGDVSGDERREEGPRRGAWNPTRLPSREKELSLEGALHRGMIEPRTGQEGRGVARSRRGRGPVLG